MIVILNLFHESFRYHSFLDKFLGVDSENIGMNSYTFVHERLSQHRLIHFVVSASTIADDIQDYIVVKSSAAKCATLFFLVVFLIIQCNCNFSTRV